MTRAVALAVVLLLAIGAAAYLTYQHAFDTTGPSAPVIVLSDAVDGGVDKPAPNVDGGLVPAAHALRAALTQVRGAVSVQNGDGVWSPAVVGAVLDADGGVRTGRNAEALVQMGNGVQVRLSPRSEFTVRELSAQVSRIRLEEGHVTATVDVGGKRRLSVAAKGSGAEVESGDGQFGVVTDGRGQLAVATTTGQVQLKSAGRSVTVAAGETSVAARDAAPTAPAQIPSTLFLKIAAGADRTNQLSTTVNGTTAPGALVHVNDAATTADAQGRFSVKLPLVDGKNAVNVDVTDAGGRTQQLTTRNVTVDRQKPKIEAATQWGNAP